jgi:hypothetical protein
MYAPRIGGRTERKSLFSAWAINLRLAQGARDGHRQVRVAFAIRDRVWVLAIPVGSHVLYAAAGHTLELRTPEGVLVRYRVKR